MEEISKPQKVSKSQNKNINRNMNQKELILSANCPQKMEMVVLNGDLMRAAEGAFWRFSPRKLFLNSWSVLRKITPMESDLKLHLQHY